MKPEIFAPILFIIMGFAMLGTNVPGRVQMISIITLACIGLGMLLFMGGLGVYLIGILIHAWIKGDLTK